MFVWDENIGAEISSSPMKEKGQLNPNKRITNHSARKYLVQKLRDNEVQSTDIMQISGHKNINSVNSYSSISENNLMGSRSPGFSNILGETSRTSLICVPVLVFVCLSFSSRYFTPFESVFKNV
jgi:hypothetical protein